MRRVLLSILLLALTGPLTAQEVKLPNKDGSVKFAVVGDTGTGGSDQYAVGKQIVNFRAKFPFDFAIMLGDNMYGGQGGPKDFNKKFEAPYKPLLDAKVKFYAALGNHDNPNQRSYTGFNMNGERYYSFKPSLNAGVRFFALDSNYMDPKQIEWFEKELAGSGSDWKIAFFHHPPYSSGGAHGSDTKLRQIVEPIFIRHGVNVVFAGHEHFYERIKPQNGIYYFISGSGGKLRKGDVKKDSSLTAKAYDDDMSFMLIEIDDKQMHFQVVNRTGETVDSGIITNQRQSSKAASSSQ